uniref:3-keto-alpha-glucoside-1,2-lyase/3-keto-2-hydroxy-glucal hydratase domain-containing protein n=1 Tax=Solibacter usitatus (strain Ellin6076) TaxID=234267 RepID=Q022N3_SOLUE
MKLLPFILFTALFLRAQTPPAAQQKKGPSGPPPEAGDDVRGYNDTPQLPGQKWKVHDITRPRPAKVTPAPYVNEAPPADAIVLFDGKDLSKWTQQVRGGGTQEPKWKVEDGYLEIVPRTGKLVTKDSFGDCQLHVEWQIPKTSVGNGQGIGNSGIELMTRYEIQVLESNEHQTYSDGGAGAIYGVWPPLVNPSRPMGEWNVYDIFFEAPKFEGEKLLKPAYITVLFNGVLVQNHKDFLGTTIWRQVGTYKAHPAEQPLSLQDHSQPVRFRNIWIRKVAATTEQ